MLRRGALTAVVLSVIACGDGATTAPTGSLPPPVPAPPPIDATEVQAGGATTTRRLDEKAFSQFPPPLTFSQEANFKSGDLLFRSAPRGVGPLFNARSCQGCHVQDGRGSVSRSPTEPQTGLLFRLSIEENGVPGPAPTYGGQLQSLGVAGDGLPHHDGALPREDAPFGDGATGEAFATVVTEVIPGEYPDGIPFQLHRPVYVFQDLAYGSFSEGLQISPRLAPPVIGMGLLEAIPAERIRALADPDDANRDGISGRANEVLDLSRGEFRLGRFGWKASQPSVLQQVAGAYNGDLGATTSVFPDESCTAEQEACLDAADRERDSNPGGIDLSDLELALVEFYSRNLAVPRRRGWLPDEETWEPTILRGRDLFTTTGCASCHVPAHETGTAEGSVLGDVDLVRLETPSTPLDHLSNQKIWPYTDLLLHDMGGSCEPLARETAEGAPCDSGAECLWVLRCDGLADDRPDAEANGREWRTPPLWGLGLTRLVNERAGYLHDGRARTVEEAILWHDGEARTSRETFMDLSLEDRSALLAFLESQ